MRILDWLNSLERRALQRVIVSLRRCFQSRRVRIGAHSLRSLFELHNINVTM